MSDPSVSSSAILNFSFNPACLIPCMDMDEAIAASNFLEAYRKTKIGIAGADLGDLGQRMLKNLREPYLRPEYRKLLAYLSGQKELVHNYKVAEDLGLNTKQPGAMLAKLSARMKRALKDNEISNYPTPVYCLVEVLYDEHGSSSYVLTEEGRRVVKALLAD